MASGCTDWDTAVPCPSGQTCSGGVCQSGGGCTHKCLPGQTSCSGQSVLACTFDGSCYVWGTGTPCPTGQTCVAGVCKEGSVTFAQSATLCGEHHYTGDVIVQGGAKVSCSGDLTITAKTIFIDPASSIVVSGSYKKLRLRATDAVTIYGAATGGSYGEVQVTAPKIEVSSSGKITASSGTVQLLHGDDLSNQGTISAKTKQISWMPPLEITSSTHPDPERWFNDTFQSVQISWTKPYPEAKGYWYLLDDKSTTQVTPFNGTFTSGHAVTYPSSTITKPGAWYFHIVTVHKNDDAGTVGNQFSFRINAKAHTVASSTHPSQSTWYSDPSKKTVTFTWSAPSGVPAGSFKGIWYRMDNAKNTETPASAGLAGWTFTTNKQVLLQKDHLGALFKDWAYYFHVVSEDTLGNLGKAVATYLVQIGAEPPKMNFFGYVTDASSAAKLSGVTVFLEPYGLSATTDTNGYFIFNSAYEGPYALTAEKTGYKTVGLQVDIKSGVVPYSFALSK
jgi:hypothetical protein